MGSVRIVLSEGGGDKRRDDAPAALSRVRQRVPHEVDAAALPGSAQHLGDRRLEALVSVGDHQLCAPKAAPHQLSQEGCPERLGFGGANIEAENLTPAI